MWPVKQNIYTIRSFLTSHLQVKIVVGRYFVLASHGGKRQKVDLMCNSHSLTFYVPVFCGKAQKTGTADFTLVFDIRL